MPYTTFDNKSSKCDIIKLYNQAKVFSNKASFLHWYFSNRSNVKVLDVGFFGHGLCSSHKEWPHRLIKERVASCFGIDINPDVQLLDPKEFDYKICDAENFYFDEPFDVIFAGDLIEHLSNPGNFLESCRRNLTEDGELLILTPNPYFLEWILQKVFLYNEPKVNPEHCCYFNPPTLTELARRYGFVVNQIYFLRRLGLPSMPGQFEKLFSFAFSVVNKFTKRFMETYVFVLQKSAPLVSEKETR